MSDKNESGDMRQLMTNALRSLKKTKTRLGELEQERTQPIAVIGMGCRFPGGISNPEDFWSALIEGRDCITEVPPERWAKLNFTEASDEDVVHFGGFVSRFDLFDALFFGISPVEADTIDPQQRWLLEVCWETFEHAGLVPEDLYQSNTAVMIGASQFEYCLKMYEDIGLAKASPMMASGTPMSAISGRIAYHFGLMGPCFTVDTACSSSLVALNQACESLRRKECDVALAGGSNTVLAPLCHVVFSRAGMLAKDGRCKTFDASADGYGRSEGVAVVLLKRLSDALAGPHPILAVIRETTVNQDGPSGGLTVPNGLAQAKNIRDALDRTGLQPDEIDYIEAHGTGTPLGDPIEVGALASVFSKSFSRDNPMYLGSSKTNLGHMEATAAMGGLFKVILQLQHRQLAPHLHLNNPNPHIDWDNLPFVIPRAPMPWLGKDRPRRAGINTFGITGTNAHAIVEEAPARSEPQRLKRPGHLFLLSAKDEEALQRKISDLGIWLDSADNPNLGDVAHTLVHGRTHFKWRCALLAASADELSAALKAQTGEPGAWWPPIKISTQTGLVADDLVAAAEQADSGPRAVALAELAQAFCDGANPRSAQFYPQAAYGLLHLPTYPFAETVCWYRDRDTSQSPQPPACQQAAGEPQPQGSLLRFEPVWEESEPPASSDWGPGPLVVFDDENDRYQALKDFLEAQPAAPPLILVKSGPAFGDLGNGVFQIRPLDMGDLAGLWEHIAEQAPGDGFPSAVIHLRALDDAPVGELSALNGQMEAGYHQAFALVRSLLERKPGRPLHLTWCYPNLVEYPHHAAVYGLAKSLFHETPLFRIKLLALSQTQPQTLWQQVLPEARSFEQPAHIRLDQSRQAHTLVEREQNESSEDLFVSGGTYLITGGAGGLGLILANHLAQTHAANLILVGRSAQNERIQAALDQIRGNGGKARYVQADVSKREDVDAVVADLESTGLNGVIHAAGLLRDSFILKKTDEESRAVLVPKIVGCLNLDLATRHLDLDVFVLFSSLAAVAGNAGQADYAYANSFLDGYAALRETLRLKQERSGRTITLNWPLWESGGMQISSQERAMMLSVYGVTPLPDATGLAAFQAAMSGDSTQVALVHGVPEILRASFIRQTVKHSQSSQPTDVKSYAPHAATLLKKVLNEETRIPISHIDVDAPMEDYGLDSIMVTGLTQRLEETLGPLSKTLMFEYQTIAELAEYLGTYYQEALQAFLPESPVPVTQVNQPVVGAPVPVTQPSLGTVARVRPETQEIAVIGMAGRYPDAPNLRQFWTNLCEGRNSVTEVPPERWDWQEYYDPNPDKAMLGKIYCKWGAFLDDAAAFDSMFFKIAPIIALSMDPQERLFLETAWATLEDGGYTAKRIKQQSPSRQARVGVFAAVTTKTYHLLSYQNELPESYLGCDSSSWSLANRISYLLDFTGPSLALDTACSGSLVAVHHACESLRNGECDMALAGGVNLYLHPSKYVNLCYFGMLSTAGRCASFGAGADGFAPGEGVGSILLKPLTAALADGDRIDGIIKGTAVNHDGKTNGYNVPNPRAQTALVRDCLERAHVPAHTIGYLEAHGTGTALGDPIELRSLNLAFGLKPQEHVCALGSAKSNIGHLEAAAGIAGITKVLLQLRHRCLVPSLHAQVLNPDADFANSPFRVQKDLAPWHPISSQDPIPLRAGVSSFGAGGVNAHVIVEQAPPTPPREVGVEPVLVVLSARDASRLRVYAQSLATFLEGEGYVDHAFRLQIQAKLDTYLLNLAAKLLFVAPDELDINDDLRDCGMDQRGFMALSDRISECLVITPFDADAVTLADLACQLRTDFWEKVVCFFNGGTLPATLPAVDLQALAYTLQIGRTPMKERFAVVVEDARDLHRQLVLFAEGGSGTFQHGAQQDIKGLDGFLGPEIETRTQVLVQTGDLAGLAAFWVAGAPLDFRVLWPDQRPPILSLPTYPFARDRHWPEAGQSVASPLFQTAEPQIKVHKPQADDDLLGYLQARVGEFLLLKPSEVDPHADFEDFGLDSVMIGRLNLLLEERFGKLPATLLFKYKNLADLAANLATLETSTPKEQVKLQSSPAARPPSRPADIAVIGLAGRYPMAPDLDTFWENLKAGKDCVSEIPIERWDNAAYYDPEKGKPGRIYTKWGAFLDGIDRFDPQFFNISPLEARLMDPQERLFLQTTWACLEDAGHTRQSLGNPAAGDGRGDVGVFAGVSYNHYAVVAAEEWGRDQLLPIPAQTFSIANRVSYLLNFSGPSLTIDTACSTSLYALHLACESLRQGQCSAAIAGGVNLSLHPSKYMLLCAGGFAAADGHCRAFSEGGEGYVSGEGVGVVLLKPLEDAARDGDHIYGLIKGTAVNHDGKTHGYSVPNPVAQAEVIESALEVAGVHPRTISYMEAHGTGTALGDPIEVAGLCDAWTPHTGDTGFCAIGSIKTNIGHLEAAAGISQLTKVLLQMRHRILVPTLIHGNGLNPAIDFDSSPFSVQRDLAVWDRPVVDLDGQSKEYPRRAGISSFGAGGVNVHAIVEEYGSAKVSPSRHAVLLPFSAKTRERLDAVVAQALAFARSAPADINLADIAHTLQVGRETFDYRVVFQADSPAGWINQMVGWTAGKTQDGVWTGKREKQAAQPINTTPEALAQAWVRGAKFQWPAEPGTRKVSLPTYPFLADRYWVTDLPSAAPLGSETALVKTAPAKAASPPPVINKVKHEDAISGVLTGLLMSVLGFEEGFEPPQDQGFFDMGMESIQAERFQQLIEQRFALPLSPTAVFDYPDLAALSEYVSSVQAECDPSPLPSPQAASPQSNADSRIAVVGMACRFPAGCNTPEKFWDFLEQVGDACVTVPENRWPADLFYDEDQTAPGTTYVNRGSFLSEDPADFDARFFGISPREAADLDPQQRLLLEVSWEAVERAGYNPEDLKGSETGVFVGIVGSDYATLPRNMEKVSHFSGTGILANTASGRISYVMGLNGPALSVDTACSASSVCVHLANRSLRDGECDMALVGGVCLYLSPYGFITLSKVQALAPDGRSKTFSAQADGYGRGEGCGMLLLKRMTDAQNDGDNILAVIHGSAVNQDGPSSGLTVPNGRAQERLLRTALTDAGLTPQQVGLIELHGTGTALGDPIEVGAISRAYKAQRTRPLLLTAVKPNIGHLEAAAGIAGIIKLVLCVGHRRLPGLRPVASINPKLSLKNLSIAFQGADWPAEPMIGGASSFGFSGTNAHVLVGEPPPRPAPVKKDGPYLLKLSARDDQALAQYASALHAAAGDLDLDDLCHTANTGRADFSCRAALVFNDRQELQRQLSQWTANPNGSYRGTLAPNTRIRTLFVFHTPAEGADRLISALTEVDPAALKDLEQLDGLFAANGCPGLAARLQQASPQEPELTFALLLLLARRLIRLNIRPDGVGAEGVGTLAAAAVAGCLSLERAVYLVTCYDQWLAGEISEPFKPAEINLYPHDLTQKTDRACGADPNWWLAQARGRLAGPDQNESDTSVCLRLADTAPEMQPKRALLGQLAWLHAQGCQLNWAAIGPLGRKIVLPTYPFQRKSYWLERIPFTASSQFFSSRGQADRDVLAPRRLPSPGGGFQFAFSIGPESLPELKDNHYLVHVGYYTEMLARVIAQAIGDGPWAVENMEFQVGLQAKEPTTIHLILEPAGERTGFGFYAAKEGSEDWTAHVRGSISHGGSALNYPLNDEMGVVRQRCQENWTGEHFYNLMDEQGFGLGRSVRLVDTLQRRKREALARFKPAIQTDRTYQLGFHPGILDACAQLLIAAADELLSPGMRFMVVRWGRLEQHIKQRSGALYCHAVFDEAPSDDDLIRGDFRLLDENGALLMSISDNVMRLLSAERLKALEQAASRQAVRGDGSFVKSLAGLDTPKRRNQILAALHQQTAALLDMPLDDLDVREPLHDLGVDSLVGMELKQALETLLNVSVPAEILFDSPDLTELAQHLDALLPQSQPSRNLETVSKKKKRLKARGDHTPWLAWLRPRANPEIRLFCLPYGGGSASIYKEWHDRLPEEVEVLPIQLPGRENRLKEPPQRDMNTLLDQLEPQIAPLLDRPYALWGHSMGALIAFNLGLRLQNHSTQPCQLLPAGFTAPSEHFNPKLTHHMKVFAEMGFDRIPQAAELDGFSTQQLRKMFMVDAGIMERLDMDVLKLLIPGFLADIALVNSYRHLGGTHFPGPITAFRGKLDSEVTREEMTDWARLTKDPFVFHEVDGDHINLDKDQLFSLLLQALCPSAAPK